MSNDKPAPVCSNGVPTPCNCTYHAPPAPEISKEDIARLWVHVTPAPVCERCGRTETDGIHESNHLWDRCSDTANCHPFRKEETMTRRRAPDYSRPHLPYALQQLLVDYICSRLLWSLVPARVKTWAFLNDGIKRRTP